MAAIAGVRAAGLHCALGQVLGQGVILRLFICLVSLACFGQEPPMPQSVVMQSIGKQHPYMSTTTMLVTQTVVTVYEFKFLRVIEPMETNYAFLRSNTISVVTNTSNRTP